MSKSLTLVLDSSLSSNVAWFDEQRTGESSVDEIRLRQKSGQLDVVVPGESVLLLSAPLPGKNRQRLIQAMPYAVEDQLTRDVDAHQFFLGKRLSNGEHQVAAVTLDTVKRWEQWLSTQRLEARRVLPDSVCIPTEPNKRTLVIDGQRVLSNTDQGLGYVVSIDEASVVCSMEPESEVLLYLSLIHI